MRFMLSRKGQDSQYGGYPSPILNRETMFSLPIPENDRMFGMRRNTHSCDLDLKGFSNSCCVHLDPDIRPELYRQLPKNWTPLFGQSGAAGSHLISKGIKEGDIFLFFGWFQHWDEKERCFSKEKSFHAIWGYMKIKNVLNLYESHDREVASNLYPWHPHTVEAIEKSSKGKIEPNYLFVGDPECYGSFKFNKKLQLTLPECENLTHWNYDSIPWVEKGISSHMTYHHREECMKDEFFQSTCRGQEFIIDEESSSIVEEHFRDIVLFDK